MKAELEQWQQSVVRNFRGEDYPGKRVIQPKKPETQKPAGKKAVGKKAPAGSK